MSPDINRPINIKLFTHGCSHSIDDEEKVAFKYVSMTFFTYYKTSS